MNFQEAAQQLGIPTDRIELVRRNVELKHKLSELAKAFLIVQEGYHIGAQHPDPYATCSKTACEGVRKIVKISTGEAMKGGEK